MLKKYSRLFLYAALFLPLSANAAMDPLLPCRGLECKDFSQLLGLFQNIYNMLLGFSGLVSLLFIIFGGIRMFYWSFLEDQEGELKAARTTVSRAIVGLIIIAAAYFIVNTFIVWLGAPGGINEVYNKAVK